MKLSAKALAFLLLLATGPTPTWADGDRASGRNAAHKFATLPEGVRFPEGIAANPANGDIYVATFDFQAPNKLLRYDRHGKLIAERDFGGEPLLGLAFRNGHVYIANAGNLAGFGPARIQRIAANFGAATPASDVALIPFMGPPGDRVVGNPDGISEDRIVFGAVTAAPNALTFDASGNLYVSDSFQGAIFRIDNATTCAIPCPAGVVKQHPLLATAGVPQFGANGLALNSTGTLLFIANTGDDRVLRLDLASNDLTVFTESINGADGVAFDRRGRLWVAANQNDEIVAVNENGRVIMRLGAFQGLEKDGSPDGLLFPASLVIVGDDMFVTNLALPLNETPGDETEEKVTRWTISRIKLPAHK